MKNKILLVLGLLLVFGSIVLSVFGESWGLDISIYYAYLGTGIGIGVGCGLAGYSLGELLSKRMAKTHPETVRRVAIEQADERNIALANKAKAKAYDHMLYIFAVLMIVFAFMSVPLMPILLLVAAYVAVAGINIYWLNRYQKEE